MKSLLPSGPHGVRLLLAATGRHPRPRSVRSTFTRVGRLHRKHRYISSATTTKTIPDHRCRCRPSSVRRPRVISTVTRDGFSSLTFNHQGPTVTMSVGVLTFSFTKRHFVADSSDGSQPKASFSSSRVDQPPTVAAGISSRRRPFLRP